YQGQSFGDRKDARLLEMLIRPGADSEPAIVRDIDHPARPLAGRHCGTRKDRLVTDQRQHFWCAENVHRTSAITRKKTTDYFRQLHNSQPLEHTLERQVFAE